MKQFEIISLISLNFLNFDFSITNLFLIIILTLGIFSSIGFIFINITRNSSKNKSHFCENVLTEEIILSKIEHKNKNILFGTTNIYLPQTNTTLGPINRDPDEVYRVCLNFYGYPDTGFRRYLNRVYYMDFLREPSQGNFLIRPEYTEFRVTFYPYRRNERVEKSSTESGVYSDTSEGKS